MANDSLLQVRDLRGGGETTRVSSYGLTSSDFDAYLLLRDPDGYLVGTDAKLRALMIKLLPDRLSDAVLTWALKLPR